jgi:hypothetical protein
MIRDIFGNFAVTASDYGDKIQQELKYTNYISVKPKLHTDKGVIADDFIDCAGIYLLYRNGDLIYIGHTNSSVRNRIGRFFAGVRGTERHDESHPAAYKYIKLYGHTCDNLRVKIVSLQQHTLLCDVTMEQIEYELIHTMKPILNNEIYRNRDIISHALELK